MPSFLIKKKSNIHGFGIFTQKNIKKGINFYIVPQNRILGRAMKRCAYIGNGKWAYDNNVLNWINHSCHPNTLLKIGKNITLISKKSIKKEQEITCDYKKTEINGKKLKCNCKKKNCRLFFLIKE